MRAWLRGYHVSIIIGATVGLAPLIPKWLSPVEMGVLFVLMCITYIVWLFSRANTPSR